MLPQFSRLSEGPETVYTFDMAKLHTHLLEKAASTPAAAYHNLLVLKYEVSRPLMADQTMAKHTELFKVS